MNFNSNTSKNNGHQYIALNSNGNIKNIDNCLFCSDAIKISDSKFVVILKQKENNLIICLFYLYNNDSSLR